MPFFDTMALAFESLRANKLRAALTMLGMIIGVGAVIVLVSIGHGATNFITAEFEGVGTNLLLVHPGKVETRSGLVAPRASTKRRLTLGDVEALEKLAVNLDYVAGVVVGFAAVKSNARSNSVEIFGTNESFPHIINIKLATGSWFNHDEDAFGRRVVVLGANVAGRLFPNESPIGRFVKISESEHRVVGVGARAGDRFGFNLDEMVFIPTRSAMRLFDEDKLFGIRAKAKSKVAIAGAIAEIRNILKNRHNQQEEFTVVAQEAVLDSLKAIVAMLTWALSGIAAISMLVGGIGIMNIMLVSVTERTREIGIRRAVGATAGDILKQFLAEALVISLLGGFIGLGGAVLLTYVFSYTQPSFDMRAPWWVCVFALFLSVACGVIFGLWPARRAARMTAIEALRYE